MSEKFHARGRGRRRSLTGALAAIGGLGLLGPVAIAAPAAATPVQESAPPVVQSAAAQPAAVPGPLVQEPGDEAPADE
ncbi:MAG: hypothetical protein ACTMKU_05785, partial [Actinomycetaceae bacterium]